MMCPQRAVTDLVASWIEQASINGLAGQLCLQASSSADRLPRSQRTGHRSDRAMRVRRRDPPESPCTLEPLKQLSSRKMFRYIRVTENSGMDDLIDYSGLDAAILDAIANGQREMRDLKGGAVKTEALKTAQFMRKSPPYARVVQRRLQALRSAGRICFTRLSEANPGGGWTMVLNAPGDAPLPATRMRTLGRVAHDAASKAGNWSRRWQYMSDEQKQEWESIASAVVEAYERSRNAG